MQATTLKKKTSQISVGERRKMSVDVMLLLHRRRMFFSQHLQTFMSLWRAQENHKKKFLKKSPGENPKALRNFPKLRKEKSSFRVV